MIEDASRRLAKGGLESAEEPLLGSGGGAVVRPRAAEGQPAADAVHRADLKVMDLFIRNMTSCSLCNTKYNSSVCIVCVWAMR